MLKSIFLSLIYLFQTNVPFGCYRLMAGNLSEERTFIFRKI